MNYYFDSSAIIKFVVEEKESSALRKLKITHPFTSSLTRLEVLRTMDRLGFRDLATTKATLLSLDYLELNEVVTGIAENFRGLNMLRSLDALHLATAQLVKNKIEAIVTYDQDMRNAAELLGFQVISPK